MISSKTRRRSSRWPRPARWSGALQVERLLDALTQRERRVIELRFGLGDGDPRTLEEIGREFGLSRERVRQIEGKTLAKLRSFRDTEHLRDGDRLAMGGGSQRTLVSGVDRGAARAVARASTASSAPGFPRPRRACSAPKAPPTATGR